MGERKEYQLTPAQLEALLDACKPVPYLVIGGHAPRSQQERANDAWAQLGKEMGFQPMTVRPIPGKPQRFFSAVPAPALPFVSVSGEAA